MTLYFLNPASASVSLRNGTSQLLRLQGVLHHPSSSSSSREGRAPRHRSCAPLRVRPISASIAVNGVTASQQLPLPRCFFSVKLVQIRFCFYFGFPQGMKLAGVTM